MRRSLLLMLVCVLWVPGANGDQVTLKNGDRLTGTIVSGDGKTLVLKSEFAGDVTIQWDAVTAINASQDLNLTLKDGKRLSGKVSTSDGTFVVAPGVGTAGGSTAKDTIVAVRNNAEQAVYDEQAEKMAHPRLYYFWSGVFDTGLALTRGNSSTASYTLSGNAVRATPRDKLTLYGNYVYATDNTVVPGHTTANSIVSGVRGDLNVSPRLFVFAIADFQTNELQHLDLRQAYGGGFGYHALKSARNTLDIFGGANYDRDEFGAYLLGTTPVAAVNKDSGEFLVGEEFASKFSKRSTFTERFSLFPNLSSTGQYRFQFNSSVATQLKNWLSWQFSMSDIYISYPPTGLKGNDLVLSTGLRVNWGKPAK